MKHSFCLCRDPHSEVLGLFRAPNTHLPTRVRQASNEFWAQVLGLMISGNLYSAFLGHYTPSRIPKSQPCHPLGGGLQAGVSERFRQVRGCGCGCVKESLSRQHFPKGPKSLSTYMAGVPTQTITVICLNLGLGFIPGFKGLAV